MELTYTLIASVTAMVLSWRAMRRAAPFSLLAALAAGLTATSVARILIIFKALKTKSSNSPDALFYVARHEYQALAYAVVILLALGLAAWHRQRTTPRHAKGQRIPIMVLTFGALAPPLLHRAFMQDLNASPEPGLLSQIINTAGPCIAALAASSLIVSLVLTPRKANTPLTGPATKAL